ncbi:uncharacterized protein LOC119162371 [Rhipicephalus microplus]|uniref:uncharacterized protein LOC119162371 n=1 Tax=Rhipicephalus microplus TaxID=6941 RepID=UPI003F6BCB0F
MVTRRTIKSRGEGPRPNRGSGITSRQHYSLSRGSFERPPRFERNDATSRAPPRHEINSQTIPSFQSCQYQDPATWHMKNSGKALVTPSEMFRLVPGQASKTGTVQLKNKNSSSTYSKKKKFSELKSALQGL